MLLAPQEDHFHISRDVIVVMLSGRAFSCHVAQCVVQSMSYWTFEWIHRKYYMDTGEGGGGARVDNWWPIQESQRWGGGGGS